ncbi:hypothetical protein D9756_011019 [Leucocoprinus leucothites]|uniref:DUF6533 domain-containing protein n=1 Tax=Leucocoprinus leucothites TaxID=201217 RepID=A0A8H5FRK4_9AGAR|nr:hypothetical protein D9756_011019 [Leucoagaricus leucothites]
MPCCLIMSGLATPYEDKLDTTTNVIPRATLAYHILHSHGISTSVINQPSNKRTSTNTPTPRLLQNPHTLHLGQFVGFASLTALLWDHIDTFADEVEYIWKGRKGLFIYLFFFVCPFTTNYNSPNLPELAFQNRYFTPLGFVLNLHALTLQQHTYRLYGLPSCARFVKYEGVTVALAVETVGLMMLLRIRAIYSNHLWITLFLSFLLIFETGVNIWLIAHAGPVAHNPLSGVHACSMVFDHTKPYSGVLASSSAWIPLLYDTIIFLLTLYRTIPPLRRAEASYIIQRLLEDGLLYYSVIVIVTLILTIMIVSAPEGTKNIAAQITVAMMSRITLNLRKAGHRKGHHSLGRLPSRSAADPDSDSARSRPKRDFWLLRLFPSSRRRAIHQLWERTSFFQFSYFNDDSQIQSTNTGLADRINVTVESETRIEQGEGPVSGRYRSLSRPRDCPLSIQFAKTPESISMDSIRPSK